MENTLLSRLIEAEKEFNKALYEAYYATQKAVAEIDSIRKSLNKIEVIAKSREDKNYATLSSK